MLRTTLAGLRFAWRRLIATSLAIILGVVFVTGTLVFGDSLHRSFTVQAMGSMDRVDVIALATGTSADEDEPPLLDESALRRVRELPEVAAATGAVIGSAPLLDEQGRALGTVPTVGISVGGDVPRYDAVEGRLPSTANEVALATATAASSGFEVGDTVTVLDPEGTKHDFTVTGVIDFGPETSISYRGAVAFTLDTAQRMTGVTGYREIYVRAAEGVPADQAESAVADALGADADVYTGREYGEKLASTAGVQARIFTTALLLFAAVSVFVAALVIHNTFTILVAQRQRELALLRCVGATRGQVFRAVLVEALVVGMAASAVGVVAGIGLGWGAFALGERFITDSTTSSPLVITAVPIVVGLLVGVLSSVASALHPAVRATRVPPLAALRSSALTEEQNRRVGWLRAVTGSLFLLGSAALLTVALRLGPNQIAMILVVASGLVCFVGVAVWAPLIVRGVITVLGWLVRRFGVPASLAVDNALRAPRRAAAAMIALTVGTTLITGYSVVNASMLDTLETRLDEQFPVDYMMVTQLDPDQAGQYQELPAEVVAELRSSPAISTVVTQRTEQDDNNTPVTAFPHAKLGTDIGEAQEGDLADVVPGTAAISENLAQKHEVGIGDSLSLHTEHGDLSPTVVAILPAGGGVLGVLVSVDDFERLFPDVPDSRAYITAAADASPKEVTDAVNAAIADYPQVQVANVSQMKLEFEELLNSVFLVILALLGLAVIIAVFGVANTLALSVLERSRESALLRALGLTRPQLRRMLAVEAVLLSVTGGALGIALGLLFGWAAGKVTLMGLIFTVPVAEIAGLVAVAVVAGLLAAVLPAHRASRVSVTEQLAAQ